MDPDPLHQGWFWDIGVSVAGGIAAGYGTARAWIEGLRIRVQELERRANTHEELLTQEIRLLRDEIAQMRNLFIQFMHAKVP